jgi:undecaprenyl-diphosphatase
MQWWQALILGLVQGATEFFPVSSSGHLVLMQSWMGLNGDFLLFDILLHTATLVAVVAALRKDIKPLFKPPFKTIGKILLASIPAVLTGFLVSEYADGFFSGPKYLWIFFLLTAVILVITELVAKLYERRSAAALKKVADAESGTGKAPEQSLSADAASGGGVKPLWDVTIVQAVAMGLMQGAAVIPGLSRSGSTIFGGVVAKGKREAVAKFSFFMSIPVILGAALLETVKLAKSPEGISAVAAYIPWYGYIAGMITAGIVGYFAVSLMLKVVKNADYKWFALYLAILGIVVFIVHFLLRY